MQQARRLPRFFVLMSAATWVIAAYVREIVGRFAPLPHLLMPGEITAETGLGEIVVPALIRLSVVLTTFLIVGLTIQAILLRRTEIAVDKRCFAGSFLGGAAASGIAFIQPLATMGMNLTIVEAVYPGLGILDPRAPALLSLLSKAWFLFDGAVFAFLLVGAQWYLMRPTEVARSWARASLVGWMMLSVAGVALGRFVPTFGLPYVLPGLLAGLALKRFVEAQPPAAPDLDPTPEPVQA